MKIAIGSDHRGVAQKEYLQQNVEYHTEIQWIDVGCFTVSDRCEYPMYARAVCNKIQLGSVDRGILLCGSGIGMAVAANRFKFIYAALVWNEEIARLSREHDHANVLVIGSDFVTNAQVAIMVKAWILAKKQKGRYEERIKMINAWGGVICNSD